MLHRLEIENFYAVRDAQVLDLRAASNAPTDHGRLAALWPKSTERAPKVVALFGANASGKSTILRALSFIAWFVRDSFSIAPNALLPFERFNSVESGLRPTRLSITLAGVNPTDWLLDSVRYRYEVTIGRSQDRGDYIIAESLHYWAHDTGRKVRLFERNDAGEVKAGPDFGLGGFGQALGKVLRPNASVISTLAQLKHGFATTVWESARNVFSNILIERGSTVEHEMVQFYAQNPSMVDNLNREIERVDLGIKAMRVEQGANGPVLLFTHEGHDGPVPLALESHGTKQFLWVYPFIARALETGGIALLDELDAAIHPLLLPEILRWFYDPIRNPHDAQLWMTCHNASLLEDLSKEEAFFTSKDASGRTEVYGLADVQAVRRDDNYYRKYLSGTYGAVPRVG